MAASHPIFPHLFRDAAVLTDFIQRRHHDMAEEVEYLLQDDVYIGAAISNQLFIEAAFNIHPTIQTELCGQIRLSRKD
jgi:hypothetical protein